MRRFFIFFAATCVLGFVRADVVSGYPPPSLLATELAAFFGDGIPRRPQSEQLMFLNSHYRGIDVATLRQDLDAKVAGVSRRCSLVTDPLGNLRLEMHFDYVIDGRHCMLRYGVIFVISEKRVSGVTNFEKAEPVPRSTSTLSASGEICERRNQTAQPGATDNPGGAQ